MSLYYKAIGDAYGMGFEYRPEEFVKKNNNLKQYFDHQKPSSKLNAGQYTDDTQMTLAIAEIVIEDRDIKAPRVLPKEYLTKFLEVFHRDPRDGYSEILQSLLSNASGIAFTHPEKAIVFLEERLKPFSDRNGAAMRAGPLGHHPKIEDVLLLAEFQAKSTHNTPNAIVSAQAAALLNHYFIYDLGDKKDVGTFLESKLPGDWTIPWSGRVDGRALNAVRAAVTAITQHKTLSEILWRSVDFTGDVDTVAAIALEAASESPEVELDIPDELYAGLEDGKYGKHYLLELDRKLYEYSGPLASIRIDRLPGIAKYETKSESRISS